MLRPGTSMYDDYQNGAFKLLDAQTVMKETAKLIEGLDLSRCIFRSNHVSNYLNLAGTLPQDKQRLLDQIAAVLNSGKKNFYRPEGLRHL
jgi:hypothetical protein